MKRMLLIEDQFEARMYMRQHVPSGWQILEADDGLTGLDLVREWLPALDLVLLDMRLPDMEGEHIYEQIRDISRTLPILPYTAKEEALPALSELTSVPARVNPARAERLEETLQRAVGSPTPTMVERGALRFAHSPHDTVAKARHALDNNGGQRIVVIAANEDKRAWLSQIISPTATPMRAENPPALRKLLGILNVAAIVGDAAMYGIIAPIAKAAGVPLLLVAATPAHARALGIGSVQRVFLATDPQLGAKLRAAINGSSSEENKDGRTNDDSTLINGGSVVPADILRCFADTPLSMRELEVLWLRHQGLERAQIASQLSISPATVTTHGKNVQRKLGLDRQGVQRWMHTLLSGQPC